MTEGKNQKILIVDDSWMHRKNIRKDLTASGFSVIQAANGKEGIEKIDTENPDLVLLDLLMPVMDGMEVLESLKERPSRPPVIVFSADIQNSTRNQCMALGADDFINKPINMEELVKRIRRIIEPDEADKT